MIESALKAYRMTADGATNPRGKVLFDEKGKPVRLTGTEAAGQAMGFRPYRTSMLSSTKRIADNVELHYSEKRGKLYDRLRLPDPGRAGGRYKGHSAIQPRRDEVQGRGPYDPGVVDHSGTTAEAGQEAHEAWRGRRRLDIL
ncbi:MAG: hypothetical protein MZV70_13595 [Desulfobacterales bacterium]|nr:hypothetical protein [Desulfobacterales bacterium]